jgi:hypothetical protein
MADLSIQASFNAGEWAPQLNARVDMTKYRSGAALLQNFFVDYRGGASTRPGTAYILQAFKSSTPVRLINFQAAFNVGYALEFGDFYIRFFFQGSPVLETGLAIAGASQANPAMISVPANTYSVGDWIFLSDIVGMTQLNGRFFRVNAVAGGLLTLGDLNGVPIDSTSYSPYISGGTSGRVYTIESPYAAADLALVKFAQNVSQMILCHPNYPTQILTLITAADWTIAPMVIGSTSVAPSTLTTNSTLGAGQVNYSYGVTSIDSSGQESALAIAPALTNRLDIRTSPGSNSVGWFGVSGAAGYNIYEADVSYFGIVPDGVQYGFVGTTQGTQFIDSNITPDFSQTPPIPTNPFTGSGVGFVTLSASGQYGSVPTVTFTGGSPTLGASGAPILGVILGFPITAGGSGYVVNDTVLFADGLQIQVTGETSGAVTSYNVLNVGSISSGSTPSNPLSQLSTSGSGTGLQVSPAWGVSSVVITNPGSGYQSPPTVTFSAGTLTAAGTAGLSAAGNSNPSVPSFFQQRLVLAAPISAPETFFMSKPGAFFNFDISSPSQPDDSITGTLVSGVLNTIKALVSSTSGMLILTDKASWLVNGGSSGSAISPSALVANAQSFIGASDVPPIVANYDVLYVQSKGAAVRDLAFNIYFSVFTGEDISVIASHLFYGFEILEWAWAEQPFYVVWAVRNDGVMLTLTFLKEQQFTAWTHQETQGNFKSVCAVTEPTATAGNVDAIYTVVQRQIGALSLQYIERVAERSFPNGVVDAWTVDSALQYVGAPISSFTGGEHLAGLSVTGLADGQPITPFVMPASGEFTLPVAASKVTIGLAFVCDLQTLSLQLEGEEAVQGKTKKLPYVDIRVNETLGLAIGSDFNHLTPMKDLIRGNVSSMLTGQGAQIVTDLVSGDARTFLDPTYTVPGQFCIRQALPYPATVLGVFPSYVIGDDR